MADLLLSEAEKTYITHGVQENFRTDGRSRFDYRPMEIECDVVIHANGSARLRLANTDILVAVKAEIATPSIDKPLEGRLEFFVDCSANATPVFEGRGGEELGSEISYKLAKAYKTRTSFDLKSLCILKGKTAWTLFIDILILECGGNLFDAVSLAVKAALRNTRLPVVKVAIEDGALVDLQLSDDPYDCTRLNISAAPVLITLCKIGEHIIVDPTAEEENCSSSRLLVVVHPEGRIQLVMTLGSGSFHPATLKETIKIGVDIGTKLNKSLISVLEEEEKHRPDQADDPFGFLK